MDFCFPVPDHVANAMLREGSVLNTKKQEEAEDQIGDGCGAAMTVTNVVIGT